jgi:hypothetical protein
MRVLSTLAALIWSLAFLANAGLAFVATHNGRELRDWFLVSVLVGVPLLAAVASVGLPFRLMSRGQTKAARRATLVFFVLALGGLCFEAYLFQASH